jgi:hypothetical protein
MADCTFTCPKCQKQAVVQTYGGMSDIYSMNCTKCPICVHIGLYDPSFSPLYMRFLGYTEELNKKLEAMLKPCECGGAFAANAPYRCPHCLAPFALEEIVTYIDRRVGHLVMSKAMPAVDCWKVQKNKPTRLDSIITKARISRVVVGQWALVLRGLLSKR